MRLVTRLAALVCIAPVVAWSLAACSDDPGGKVLADGVDATTGTDATTTDSTATTTTDTAVPTDATTTTATDTTTPSDTGVGDTTTPLDTGVDDTSVDDTTAPSDTNVDDTATTTDDTTADVADAPSTGAAAQIQAALDALGSSATPVTGTFDIDAAAVVYLKPATGTELAGLFLQGSPTGPAIFVEVPDTAPFQIAALVDLTITTLENKSGIPTATAVTGLAATGGSIDIGDWTQEVSDVDLVAGYADLALERVELTATVAGAFTAAGTAHSAAFITTVGNPTADGALRVRLPTAIATQSGLQPGCTVFMQGVLWRFVGGTTIVQPSAYTIDDLLVECPAAKVTGAIAASGTQVVVTFDKAIDPASVSGGGSQFTFTGGLTASNASVQGASVTLLTSQQTAGTSYTVTVAGTVTDVLGQPVDASARTATFSGFAGLAMLVVNEIDYDQSVADDPGEFLEILNTGATPVDLAPYAVQLVNGDDVTDIKVSDIPLSGTLPPGGYLVIARDGFQVTADVVMRFVGFPTTGALQNGPRDGVRIMLAGTTTVVDALLYETAASADPALLLYGEGAPFASGEANGDDPNRSIARCPNGADTNDNATDFELSTSPTPGAANVCP